MSRRQFITLRTKNANEEVDLELPANEPVGSLTPLFLKILGWPETKDGEKLRYNLTNEAGEAIPAENTFDDVGIDNFDVVRINLDDQQREAYSQSTSTSAAAPPEESNEEEDIETLPPPIPIRIPIDGPCLLSKNGTMFMIEGRIVKVGRKRKDRETQPDIDLSELDKSRIASHMHVELRQESDGIWLKALQTRNGTLLNGTLLEPTTEVRLKDGDVLRFGFRGLSLTYHTP